MSAKQAKCRCSAHQVFIVERNFIKQESKDSVLVWKQFKLECSMTIIAGGVGPLRFWMQWLLVIALI